MSKLKIYLNEADNYRSQSKKIEDQDSITIMTNKGPKTIDVKAMTKEVDNVIGDIATTFPYFGSLITNMVPIYTWEVPTMATDGARVFMNPLFTFELSKVGKYFVLMHELMHCILDHMNREKISGMRDHKKANIAADYEVNALLVWDAKIVKENIVTSLGALLDKKYEGWVFEKIYADNPKMGNQDNKNNKPQQGQGQKGQPGQPGEPGEPGEGEGGEGQPGGDPNKQGQSSMDGTDTGACGGGFLSPEEGEKIAKSSGYKPGEYGESTSSAQMSETWKNRALEAAKEGQRKMGGNSKGNGVCARLINTIFDMHRPSKDWRRELRRFIGTKISKKDEYEQYGNKKYTDIYKDTSRKDQKFDSTALGKVVFIIDTSGSMSSDILDTVVGDSYNIVWKKGISEATYIYFEGSVSGMEVIKKIGQKPNYKLKNLSGGGGTDFEAPIKFIDKELKKSPQLVVFFTDGYDNPPKYRPKWARNLVWVIYDNNSYEGPYGQTIHVSKDDMKK